MASVLITSSKIHLIFFYSDSLQFMEGYLKNWAVFVIAYSILSVF